MADEKLAMIGLYRLNGKCGRAFVVELRSLFENKGRADYPHCSQYNFYDLKKAKLLQ
jgi:hypothetical protein